MNMKKILLLSLILFLNLNITQAETDPLYDQVWKLVNTKYVDKTNNKQNKQNSGR